MARLTNAQWAQAQAEYEVRGVSLGEIAKIYRVATSSVSRKAKADGWTQGKMQDLLERKVAAVKALAEVETQTQALPLRLQYTLQSVVQERLQAEGMIASLDIALAVKSIELAALATRPDEVEILSRARRNLAPSAQQAATTVTVNQQANAGAAAEAVSVPVAPPTPIAAVRNLLLGRLDGDDA